MDEGKVFKDEVHGLITIPDYCIKIIDTPEFQRLRSIKQLGGAEYVYPGATHTRFAHSVGVCHLSLEVVNKLKVHHDISPEDEKCVVLAGLCHDLGHGPLSHKFEGVIETLQTTSPDEIQAKWTHESASVAILKRLEDKLPGDDKIKRKNMRMQITDFILGKPEKVCKCQEQKCMNGEECHQIKSADIKDKDLQKRWKHYEENRFLYQIVSNSDSGIDVDKWDYLRRDCRNLGLPNDFEHERLVKYMRVLPCTRNGCETKEICFRRKAAVDIGKMFTARWSNHELSCKHKVVMLIEEMFTEVLVKYFNANKEWWTTGKSFSDCPRIEDITGPEDQKVGNYLQMTDSILDAIERSTRDDLADAREILQRIKSRDLFTRIGYKVQDSKTAEERLADIKREDIKKSLMIAPACKNHQDIFAEDNLVVIHHKLNYGGKDKPLDNVFFFDKPEKPADADKLRGSLLKSKQKPLNFPEAVQSQSIVVYSKKPVKDKTKLNDVTKIVKTALRVFIDHNTPPAGTSPALFTGKQQVLSRKRKRAGSDSSSSSGSL